ncbi:MAG: cation:proton antiporter [Candidatus Odinarchaeota archaeon]|nr:cation:proton antiporter [Candidatus Odinarchaeota archaeon]
MEQESVLVAFMILLAGFISIELGISTAIFEILAGVIAFNVFGLTSTYWIDFLADFGLLGIMFFAGLETDPLLLRKNIKTSLTTGIVAYFLPLIAIVLTSYFMFHYHLETAFLIGISLSTTSVALVYAVIKEKSLIGGESGQVILGSAMMIDVFSMLSLTFFLGGYGIYTILYASLLIGLLYFAPKIGKTLFQRYKGHIAEIEIKFILLLLLILPFFSEHVGISEAVFAFVLGVIFSELMGEDRIVEDKLRGIVFGFLAPVFFFKDGLLIDLSSMTLETFYFIIVLGSLAYITKYASTYFTFNNLLKGDSRDAHVSGLIFNFRLTFGIVTALFGYTNHYITGSVYSALLSIILISSLISSLLLRVAPSEEFA